MLYAISKGDPSGPPVICLHGLLGSSRNLYRLVEALGAAGFHAVAFDQRGHGHSPRASAYTLEALARDVFAVMDSRGLKAAHLLGHSMGARVALQAAALDSARALSLCLLDAGPRISAQATEAVHRILDPLPDFFPDKEQARRFLERYPDAIARFLLSNLVEREGRARWMFDLAGIRTGLIEALRNDLTPAWQRLERPAFVIRGESSEHFSRDEMARMLELNPRARSREIPQAGHWVHVDNPVQTASVIIEFLKGLK